MQPKLPQRRPGPAPLEEPKPLARWAGYLLLTVILGAAVFAYVTLGRESELAGTLPLPKPLQTRSAAHGDLMLFGRALNELAVEAEQRLPEPAGSAHPLAPRMLTRVGHLHEVGHELEPRVSREEGRALLAFQQGEGLLRAFLQGEGTPPYDHALIQQVRDQINVGMELGRGRKVDQLILGKKEHLMAQEVVEDKKKPQKPKIDPFHPAASALKLPMGGEE